MVDPHKIANRDYLPELIFTTSRSSGPGGQHVNKLETRVTLRFKLSDSYTLTEEEKAHLSQKWASRLTKDGFFVLHSEKHRTQLRNKEDAIAKFRNAIVKAFTLPKPRKATKPSKASVRRRIEGKKKLSEKKNRRKPPEMD